MSSFEFSPESWPGRSPYSSIYHSFPPPFNSSDFLFRQAVQLTHQRVNGLVGGGNLAHVRRRLTANGSDVFSVLHPSETASRTLSAVSGTFTDSNLNFILAVSRQP